MIPSRALRVGVASASTWGQRRGERAAVRIVVVVVVRG
jgi:hypothetical protein